MIILELLFAHVDMVLLARLEWCVECVVCVECVECVVW